ncbi:MAG: hypothetical protein NT002_13815 [candidate division Zixibacteria bacterium]|jgi:hypothetical protein|nr:hypothetical protein [candidate division Zixibacteria bacterium]
MSINRRKVLEMLAAGIITALEAEQLIGTLEKIGKSIKERTVHFGIYDFRPEFLVR